MPSAQKMAQWFWRRRFLNFIYIFSHFRYYLPLGKQRGPSFEDTRVLISHGCHVPSLVEVGSVHGSGEEENKMCKDYNDDDGQWIVIRN